MLPKQFEKVYDNIAKSMDNGQVSNDKFGPLLYKVSIEEGHISYDAYLGPASLQSFFSSEDGPQRLQDMIESMLERDADNLYVLNLYEGLVKDESITPPNIFRCIFIKVHHRTGERLGYLPIDEGMNVRYKPLLEEGAKYSILSPSSPIY